MFYKCLASPLVDKWDCSCNGVHPVLLAFFTFEVSSQMTEGFYIFKRVLCPCFRIQTNWPHSSRVKAPINNAVTLSPLYLYLLSNIGMQCLQKKRILQVQDISKKIVEMDVAAEILRGLVAIIWSLSFQLHFDELNMKLNICQVRFQLV